MARGPSYYSDKLDILSDLFGEPVTLENDGLHASDRIYPIVDDVVVLLPPEHRPPSVAGSRAAAGPPERDDVSTLVQYSFGQEWGRFDRILPEHEEEFAAYFDLIDLASIREARVCDLGCGNGRWSYHIAKFCRQLVLVDFSDAIFVARRNLRAVDHALFFMGDITCLPFRRDFADFVFCLGVLHHLPVPALAALRGIAHYAPRFLVYLYYALDSRPWYFKALNRGIGVTRRILSRVRHPRVRSAVAGAAAVGVYWPLVQLGRIADAFGQGRRIPLYEAYVGKSLLRIQQDAYDRLFTSIEQRVSRKSIETELSTIFSHVQVSDNAPYWHFLCMRQSALPSPLKSAL